MVYAVFSFNYLIFKKKIKKKNARIFCLSKITLIAHLRSFGAWLKKKKERK